MNINITRKVNKIELGDLVAVDGIRNSIETNSHKYCLGPSAWGSGVGSRGLDGFCGR